MNAAPSTRRANEPAWVPSVPGALAELSAV